MESRTDLRGAQVEGRNASRACLEALLSRRCLAPARQARATRPQVVGWRATVSPLPCPATSFAGEHSPARWPVADARLLGEGPRQWPLEPQLLPIGAPGPGAATRPGRSPEARCPQSPW